MQRDEAMRAAHQAEAVAALSVGQLASAAAFFQAEDDLSRHEFEVSARSLLSQGALERRPPSSRGCRRRSGQRFERSHGLTILERVGPLGFDRSRPRPDYFPITYVAAERNERRPRARLRPRPGPAAGRRYLRPGPRHRRAGRQPR